VIRVILGEEGGGGIDERSGKGKKGKREGRGI